MTQKFEQVKPKKWKSLLCRANDHYTCGLSFSSDSWTTTNYCDCGCHGQQRVESVEEILRSFYERAQKHESVFTISKNNFTEIMKYYQPEITEEEIKQNLGIEQLLFGVRVELED